MASAGIRQLKDNLSRYIRRLERGERLVITAHGRVVAELIPPGSSSQSRRTPLDELVTAGAIRPAVERGPVPDDWPDIRLPHGSAAGLIDRDRGER